MTERARDRGRGEIDPPRPPAELPAVMLDGIEQRRTEPAGRDDPAELEARLADLRERVAAATGSPEGGWHTVGREQAAHQLAARGVDQDTARAMVADYLRETSERAGAPAQEWGLDQGDLDAIAAEHGLPTTLPPVVVSAYATAENDDADLARAAQLSRWHTDDTTSDRGAFADADGSGDTDEEPADDGGGWSR